MAFDAVNRMLLESAGDNLSGQISAELKKLDGEAAKMREAGGAPLFDLQPRVTELEGAISRATMETIGALDEELETIHEQWVTTRDKNPGAETATLLRAQNRIRAMSKEEAEKVAMDYATGETDLDMYALNELKTSLQVSGSDVDLSSLNSGIAARHGDRPWLQGSEATELMAYRDRLSALEPGHVVYANTSEDILIDMPISDLVDYQGELDRTGYV